MFSQVYYFRETLFNCPVAEVFQSGFKQMNSQVVIAHQWPILGNETSDGLIWRSQFFIFPKLMPNCLPAEAFRAHLKQPKEMAIAKPWPILENEASHGLFTAGRLLGNLWGVLVDQARCTVSLRMHVRIGQ